MDEKGRERREKVGVKNEGERGREKRRAEGRIKEYLHVCGTSSSQHFHII